jgi:hypothetical protein
VRSRDKCCIQMRGCSKVLVTGGAGFVRFESGVGVAEGLGGGLQIWFCC